MDDVDEKDDIFEKFDLNELDDEESSDSPPDHERDSSPVDSPEAFEDAAESPMEDLHEMLFNGHEEDTRAPESMIGLSATEAEASSIGLVSCRPEDYSNASGSSLSSEAPEVTDQNEVSQATGPVTTPTVIDLEDEMVETPRPRKAWHPDDQLVSTEKHERLKQMKATLALMKQLCPE